MQLRRNFSSCLGPESPKGDLAAVQAACRAHQEPNSFSRLDARHTGFHSRLPIGARRTVLREPQPPDHRYLFNENRTRIRSTRGRARRCTDLSWRRGRTSPRIFADFLPLLLSPSRKSRWRTVTGVGVPAPDSGSPWIEATCEKSQARRRWADSVCSCRSHGRLCSSGATRREGRRRAIAGRP